MSEPQACRRCGCSGDPGAGGTLSWTCDQLPDGGSSWMCGDCARSQLGAIETRVPDEWWWNVRAATTR